LQKEKQVKYIKIWEDLADVRDLVKALILCIGFTLTGYFIAPQTEPLPLFFGLGGALIGFLLSSLWIQAKRDIVEEKGR
jgi:hypothetical protein